MNPSLSLLIIKTNIPDGFALQDSTVKNKEEVYYKSVFRAYQSDNRYNKLMVFENIAEGDYRINSLLAETSKSSTSTNTGNYTYTKSTWKVLDLKFKDLDSAVKTKNDKWFSVPSSSVIYAGDIAWFPNSSREEIISKMAEVYKKPKKDVIKSILYDFNLKTSKSDDQYFMVRLDHPVLIGEEESLKNEIRMLLTFKKGKKSKNKIWNKMIDSRITELNQKLLGIKAKK